MRPSIRFLRRGEIVEVEIRRPRVMQRGVVQNFGSLVFAM